MPVPLSGGVLPPELPACARARALSPVLMPGLHSDRDLRALWSPQYTARISPSPRLQSNGKSPMRRAPHAAPRQRLLHGAWPARRKSAEGGLSTDAAPADAAARRASCEGVIAQHGREVPGCACGPALRSKGRERRAGVR